MDDLVESGRPEHATHCGGFRQVRHTAGEIAIGGTVGKQCADTGNDATEIHRIAETNDRVARSRDVEQGDPPAWTDDSRQFAEKYGKFDEVTKGKAARDAVDGTVVNGQVQGVGLGAGRPTRVGREHAEGEVEGQWLQLLTDQFAAQITRATGEIEHRRASRESE